MRVYVCTMFHFIAWASSYKSVLAVVSRSYFYSLLTVELLHSVHSVLRGEKAWQRWLRPVDDPDLRMVKTSSSFLSLTNLTIREQHIDSRTMERGNYSNTEVSDTTKQSQINRGTAGNETLKSNPLRSPPTTSTGWASMGSTTAFRAINFELFVKPVSFLILFHFVL